MNRHSLYRCLALTGLLLSSASFAQDANPDCDQLLEDPSIRLEDALATGCELSPAQISALMDNPVGEMISVPLQFDALSVREPFTGTRRTVETVKLIPTFPTAFDEWSLVHRIVLTHVRLPIDVEQVSVGYAAANQLPTAAGSASPDIFGGSTGGLGDTVYVGLLTPRDPLVRKNGKLVWAVGPTVTFPTAGEDVLGQGKVQLGPAFALGYLGRRWTLGFLAQHWWSVSGDGDRPAVSQTNLQYFAYRRLRNQWSIGAAPNITADWAGSGSPDLGIPVGLGINKTLFLGRLPLRVGLEYTYYLDPDDDAISARSGVRLSITPALPSAFLSRGRR